MSVGLILWTTTDIKYLPNYLGKKSKKVLKGKEETLFYTLCTDEYCSLCQRPSHLKDFAALGLEICSTSFDQSELTIVV